MTSDIDVVACVRDGQEKPRQGPLKWQGCCPKPGWFIAIHRHLSVADVLGGYF